MSSVYQIFVEYILVYCTAVGLIALGEPSLSDPPSPPCNSPSFCDEKPPMPVWMIFIFVFLAFAKWFLSFLLSYLTLLTTAVVSVSINPTPTLSALCATPHPTSQHSRLTTLIRQIRVVGAFKAARASRLSGAEIARRRSVASVSYTRADLRRRSTLAPPIPPSNGPVVKLWRRITSLACFRGFTALLTISTAQWLLGFIADFLLSGQPVGHKLGYGTTSLVLKTTFAQAYAVWTHYSITPPSNKGVFEHFPKGNKVLMELWPLMALWSMAEHLCLSMPLALSRHWELRQWAFDAEVWNQLDGAEMRLVLAKFAAVWALYVALTVLVALPMTVVTRRVHASMLSDEDLAIVPFRRGRAHTHNNFAQRNEIKKPALTAGEAWECASWATFARVLWVYLQGWILQQMLQWGYWWMNWRLHEALGVHQFSMTRLPWSPVGVIRSLGEGKLPVMGDEGRSEL